MPVHIPDDTDFATFKEQCESQDGWTARYNKGGVTVWCRDEETTTVQKLKMKIVCKDVRAETLYDVLHDTSYRKKWDTNMIDTFDIGKLTVNADVGYYSWRCPSPLKNRDFVTMRSWLPLGNDYLIINHSVKHPQYPPKKDYVRAVSLLTGYLIQSNGTNACTLYYLTQVDPRGLLLTRYLVACHLPQHSINTNMVAGALTWLWMESWYCLSGTAALLE
ncbi:START domain-containing protein 10 isoform X3 [Electrophorus electricus]|nr:START domain-containing protein 10 isoform X3 [Electrophorus electricus]